MCVEQEIAEKRLVSVRVPEIDVERKIYLVKPSRRAVSYAAEAFPATGAGRFRPMKKKIIRITGVALVLGVLYALDFLSALAGVPARPRYSTITVNRFLYINEKYDKFSYEPIPFRCRRNVSMRCSRSGACAPAGTSGGTRLRRSR